MMKDKGSSPKAKHSGTMGTGKKGSAKGTMGTGKVTPKVSGAMGKNQQTGSGM